MTELRENQEAFVAAYVLGGGNATQAAVEAGYSPLAARQTASRLLHLPHVQDGIRREQGRLLRGRLASKALSVLEKILDDDNAPPGVRVDAAKTVLDRAGLAAGRTPECSSEDGKSLHEMDISELAAFIAEGQRALGMLAIERSAGVEMIACSGPDGGGDNLNR